MRIKPEITLIAIICLLSVNNAFSQQNPDSVYGLNPLLYNGKVYSYAVPKTVEGHQFLNSTKYVNGSVRINKKTYNGLQLNYDIYNQNIILKFDKKYELQTIKLLNEKVSQFTLEDKVFILIPNEDSINIIYQAFGKNKYQILFYWKKNLRLSNISGSTTYQFSAPSKTFFLKKNNQIYPFRNKRTFLSLFNKKNKIVIKKFLKNEKIKFRQINDIEINKLINFCNANLP